MQTDTEPTILGQRQADEAQRTALLAQMDALGTGARMVASRDLGLAPVTISRALTGEGERPDVLHDLAVWLTLTSADDVRRARAIVGRNDAPELVAAWLADAHEWMRELSVFTDDTQHPVILDAVPVDALYRRYLVDRSSAPLSWWRFVVALAEHAPVYRTADGVYADVTAINAL